jgi:voltage-gated potassium channel
LSRPPLTAKSESRRAVAFLSDADFSPLLFAFCLFGFCGLISDGERVVAASRAEPEKNMYEKIKYHVYDILVETDDNELIDRVVAVILMLLILVSVGSVILETVPEYEEAYGSLFHSIEIVSVTIFAAEYLLRLWVAPLDPAYQGRFGRLRYAFSLMALIDLIAILPTILALFSSLVFPVDLMLLRFLRTFRLFRLFKMSRYVQSLNTLDDAIIAKKEELLVSVIMMAMLILFSSSLMYLVEHQAQPDKFPSIPATLWWGVVTITSVGYGDTFPITPLGKLLGGVTAVLGVAMFALPTGIFAASFADEMARQRRHKDDECCCPKCGCDLSADFEKKAK